MTGVHIVLGVAVIAANLAAGLYGAWAWWRWTLPTGFWPLLRTAQALVALQAVLDVETPESVDEADRIGIEVAA